jgi:hypothetical protein
MGTGYWREAKRPGLGADHPNPSSDEVKERVKLYLYSRLLYNGYRVFAGGKAAGAWR